VDQGLDDELAASFAAGIVTLGSLPKAPETDTDGLAELLPVDEPQPARASPASSSGAVKRAILRIMIL
jgi:hypothetical protein